MLASSSITITSTATNLAYFTLLREGACSALPAPLPSLDPAPCSVRLHAQHVDEASVPQPFADPRASVAGCCLRRIDARWIDSAGRWRWFTIAGPGGDSRRGDSLYPR